MKLFFLIVCHKITPSLLYNLKKFSTFKKSKVLVHIDKKSNFGEKELIKAKNINYIKERVDIKWGSISQVFATYNMLLSIDKEDFDYVSLMSGEDLFIRSEDEFLSFLKLHYGKEFLGVQKKYDMLINPKDRYIYKYPSFFFNPKPSMINKYIIRIYSFLFKLGFLKNKKKKPYAKFYKGSNWFTISKEVSRLFIKEIEQKKLFDYFKHSFCIDEVIFQTILINNGLLKKIYLIDHNVNDNKMSLRYINWEDGPEYPKVLKKKDLLQPFDKDIFFVRKISNELNEQTLSSLFE
jgi:hypothetical protein